MPGKTMDAQNTGALEQHSNGKNRPLHVLLKRIMVGASTFMIRHKFSTLFLQVPVRSNRAARSLALLLAHLGAALCAMLNV